MNHFTDKFQIFCVVLCIAVATSVTTADDKTEAVPSSLKTQPLVYSYSKIVQRKDGTSLNKMLTILSGKDGKYHYVKAEGPEVEKGVWNADLPEMPDVGKLISEKTKEVSEHLSAVDALVKSFDQTVDSYLKALKD